MKTKSKIIMLFTLLGPIAFIAFSLFYLNVHFSVETKILAIISAFIFNLGAHHLFVKIREINLVSQKQKI